MEIVAVLSAVAAGLLIIKEKPRLTGLITIAYLAALIYVTFLMRLHMSQKEGLFEPFLTVIKMARGAENLIQHLTSGTRFNGEILDVLREILINISIFIPFGYLLPSITDKINTRKKVVLIASCCSVLIEVVQQISKLGMMDLSDILNNTLGALIGYGLYKRILNSSATQCRSEEDHGK